MPDAPRKPGVKQVLKTLERVISKAGAGSRTDARRWIADGRVRVNGKLIQTPDFWVAFGRDKVTLDGKALASGGNFAASPLTKGYLTANLNPERQAHRV